MMPLVVVTMMRPSPSTAGADCSVPPTLPSQPSAPVSALTTVSTPVRPAMTTTSPLEMGAADSGCAVSCVHMTLSVVMLTAYTLLSSLAKATTSSDTSTGDVLIELGPEYSVVMLPWPDVGTAYTPAMPALLSVDTITRSFFTSTSGVVRSSSWFGRSHQMPHPVLVPPPGAGASRHGLVFLLSLPHVLLCALTAYRYVSLEPKKTVLSSADSAAPPSTGPSAAQIQAGLPSAVLSAKNVPTLLPR
mmetsp:Transcript_11223/g.39056  ORF Transcript_11223/g.39056 Transcript_11223/m.39056 type:complete len:246 (-) Transcript_11223:751-1488(-)